LGVVYDNSEDWVLCSIVYTHYSANRKVSDVIIDSGACTNIVSTDMVNKLQLNMESHHQPYKMRWM
jgi:hypothetical protein